MQGLVLDRYTLFSSRTQFTPAFGLTKINPISRLVAGTEKPLFLHEGLQQDGTIALDCLPMVGKHLGRRGEDHGCQILGLDPGQNQKTGVVDDQWEISLALIVAPTDIAVAGGV